MSVKSFKLRHSLALAACLFAGAAFAAESPPQEKPGKFAAIGDPTQLIICQVAPFPGGVSCSSPISLGSVYSFGALTSALVDNLGCSTLGSGVFNCTGATQVPGVFISYTYTGTNDVSRVIYIMR